MFRFICCANSGSGVTSQQTTQLNVFSCLALFITARPNSAICQHVQTTPALRLLLANFTH